MARREMAVRSDFAPEFLTADSQGAALLLAAAAVPAMAVALLAPGALALPLAALVSLSGAALLAMVAWFSGARRDGARLTLWDAAGLCLFVALAAGMLSEFHHAAELLGLTTTAP